MDFKQIGINTAVASTIVAGSVIVASPAKAVSVIPPLSPGDFLSIRGDARFEDNLEGSDVFNFFELANPTIGYGSSIGQGRIGIATTPVFGAYDSILNLKDLNLTQTSASTWKLDSSPLDGFITNLSDSRKFNLENFDLTKDGSGNFTAKILGHFDPPGIEGFGNGNFTTQAATLNFNGTTYSLDITAVPTPALLPGLIGMGVAAVRKKKQKELA